jgi:hypothetical protein
MKKVLLVLGSFSLIASCSSASDDSKGDSRAQRVVLDVRCSSDSDCPAGYECEVENEHGASTSYCKSHESNGADSGSASPSSSACPPGFERETEHGGVFCKPHGGGNAAADGGSASASASGVGCSTDADCADGLECESELEHGVATSFCKPHGGGKK